MAPIYFILVLEWAIQSKAKWISLKNKLEKHITKYTGFARYINRIVFLLRPRVKGDEARPSCIWCKAWRMRWKENVVHRQQQKQMNLYHYDNLYYYFLCYYHSKKEIPGSHWGAVSEFPKKLLLPNLTRQKSEALSPFEKHKIVTGRD